MSFPIIIPCFHACKISDSREFLDQFTRGNEVANKNHRWGIFRLTDPPGLKTILNCTQTGIFHPHAVDNIYTDAQKPGHVWELPGLEFQVVDLRGKS